MNENAVVTGRDLVASARDNGAALRTASEQAKAHALTLWAMTPSALTDALGEVLDRVEAALAAHKGNLSERMVYTRSLAVRVREDMRALNAMTLTGTDEYARLLDDLRMHFAAMTAQVPASIQTVNADTGKRERDNERSDFLRGVRSLGAQSNRLAPSYIPESQRDALAGIRERMAERESQQTERNRKRLTQAVTDAQAKLTALSADASQDTRDALEVEVLTAQMALEAFNASHPLAITGEAGK